MYQSGTNSFDPDIDRAGFAERTLFTYLLHDSADRLHESAMNLKHCDECGHCCEQCSARRAHFKMCAVLFAGVVLGRDAVSSGEERYYWLSVAGIDSVAEDPRATPLGYLELLRKMTGLASLQLLEFFEDAADEGRHLDCPDYGFSFHSHEYLYALAEVGLAQHALLGLIARHANSGESIGDDGAPLWLGTSSLMKAVLRGSRWIDEQRFTMWDEHTGDRIEKISDMLMFGRSLARFERTFVELHLFGASAWSVERSDGRVVLRSRPPDGEPVTVPFVIGEVYRMALRFASLVYSELVPLLRESGTAEDGDEESPNMVSPLLALNMLVGLFVEQYADIRCETARFAELTGSSAEELVGFSEDCSDSELSTIFGSDASSVRAFLNWFNEDVLEVQSRLMTWVDQQHVDIEVDLVFRELNSGVQDDGSAPNGTDRQILEVVSTEHKAIELLAKVASARRYYMTGLSASTGQQGTHPRPRVSEWTQTYGYHAVVTNLTHKVVKLCEKLSELGVGKFSSTQMLGLSYETIKLLEVVHRSHALILRDEQRWTR